MYRYSKQRSFQTLIVNSKEYMYCLLNFNDVIPNIFTINGNATVLTLHIISFIVKVK